MTAKRKSFLSVIGLLAVFSMVFIGCGQTTGSEPADDTYIVTYSANGGSGSMSNSVFTIDVPGTLKPNAFTWQNHTFLCWTANSNGSGTQYQDGQQVLNLADAGQTKTLYAKWDEDDIFEPGNEFTVNAGDFNATIESISTTPGAYLINLEGNLPNYAGFSLNTAGVEITVKGTGSNEISWNKEASGPSALFHLNGASLKLQNIKLSRSAGNTEDGALLCVESGTLEIKSGVNISNNINGTEFFDGISINDGNLTVSGGTIENCLSGIVIDGEGTSVSMSGGVISKNTHGATFMGTSIDCSFAMSGGSIKDNIEEGVWMMASSEGASFEMSGGNITGNKRGAGSHGKNSSIIIANGNISNSTRSNIYFDNGSEDCTLIISGGTINDSVESMGIAINDKGHTIEIKGRTISGNRNGLWVQDLDHKITISNGSISANRESNISLGSTPYLSKNCKLTISGGTISGSKLYSNLGIGGEDHAIEITGGTISKGNEHNIIFNSGSNNCELIINGGTISDSVIWQGIHINGQEHTVEISNGTITGNNQHGIEFNSNSKNCTLIVSGNANINGNGSINASNEYSGSGININGQENTVEINGGIISDNYSPGVNFNAASSTCKLIISGGTISKTRNPESHGIQINGQLHSIEINGGAICEQPGFGVSFSSNAETCKNNFLTMTAGVIKSNGYQGLNVRGSNNGFKKTGGTIYGNDEVDGDNRNMGGAIRVRDTFEPPTNFARLFRTTSDGETLAATINEDQTGLDSYEGIWDEITP